ncbi:MAG: 30S ribosomal protein S20 [Planctomycetota bacterium]
MPTSLSAQKRVRQDARRRLRNRTVKAAVKTHVRKVEAALERGDIEAARAAYNAAARVIDKAVSKNVLHRNTAARRKARLARRINTAASSTPQA